jgi:3-hydroxybutyrate dehydrogenase
MPEQRVALITGATSGIGLGIARAFAAQGTIVAFSGFASPEEISRIVSELNAAGGKAEHVPADARNPLELAALVRQCDAKFGSVDILVNCAGIQHVAPIEEFPVAQWDAIIAVNLSSAFHTIRAALPGMRRRNWGRIVNIASVHGLVASIDKSAYVAAKHGLVGLTKVVALETAGSPITCNAICPGWVHTPLVQKQVDSRAKELGVGISQAERLLLQEKQPSLQFVGIDEVAALVLFVASDAAREVRGAAWTIDGGWTAQ